MRAFREDSARHRKLVFLIIKITVIILTVAFLALTASLIVDLVGGPSTGAVSGGDSEADRSAPTVRVKNGDVIYIYVGEAPVWKSYVEVLDSSGTGKITDVDVSAVDQDVPGSYQVKYTVADSAGNTETYTVEVVVTKKEYSYQMLMDMVALKAESLGITKDMTKQQQVFAIYEYVNSPGKTRNEANIVFVNESNIQSISRKNWRTDWIEEAILTLQNGSGDCYSYYSLSKAFFEYFGIENEGIRRTDSKSEYSGTHFWSMVNVGTTDSPKWYFYDSTRLSGKFSDGTNSACLRTYDELFSYVPSDPGYDANDFYVFDESKYPTAATTKIAR
jgi:hypothetical protein